LTNITVLSLRNNSLQEIPSSITRLPKLFELNIAGNQLESLPWELMNMLRSTEDACKVSLRPNPFRVPRLSADAELPSHTEEHGSHTDSSSVASTLFRELQMRFIRGRQALNGGDADATPKKKRNSKEQLIFLAPSRIIFRESDGAVARSAMHQGTEEEDAWEAPVLDKQYPPMSEASSTAPSLFELALRSAQLSYDLRDVSSDLPKDTPSTVARALEQAAHGVEYGNERCSTCSKSFVVARAEWLEYWFHGHEYYDLSEEKILPFKRKACSWDCAQVTAVGTAFA
jgi:ribosomal protein S27AE